jgi:hypothetical protein
MSLSQNLIVELAAEFRHLLQSVENAIGADDNCHDRIDIDVDSETPPLINECDTAKCGSDGQTVLNALCVR